MLVAVNEPIWFYPTPIDFRKQMDGLIILVADTVQQNPTSGQLFIFRDRSGKKIKMLWWDNNGFWLFYKRLEKGHFRFPKPSETALSLTRDQLSWLVSGIDFLNQSSLPKINATHFY